MKVETVKKRLNLKGQSDRALARKLGISHTCVQKWHKKGVSKEWETRIRGMGAL
jgi:hypothetical protein